MSGYTNTGHNLPGSSSPPPSDLPGLPQVDMMTSGEMQAWIARLEAEQKTLGTRNKYLAVAMAGGVLVLLGALWVVHRSTIGTYAVLDAAAITRHPANQGRLEISFRVVQPGKVHYRRISGSIETDVIDTFRRTGEIRRSWAWVYEPGKDIDVTLWYRRGLFRKTQTERFGTAGRADIVILIDSTGSMSGSIAELQEKCVTFSERLKKQALEHRFALIGFGDVQEGLWLDKHEFTPDVARFQQSVSEVKRFDGGDLPESVLDALEEALTLPFDEHAIRRFYLVTDAAFHEPAQSGATAADLVARMEKERVLLSVFSRPQYEDDYAKLLADTGKFQEIENFGKVLSEGRVLED